MFKVKYRYDANLGYFSDIARFFKRRSSGGGLGNEATEWNKTSSCVGSMPCLDTIRKLLKSDAIQKLFGRYPDRLQALFGHNSDTIRILFGLYPDAFGTLRGRYADPNSDAMWTLFGRKSETARTSGRLVQDGRGSPQQGDLHRTRSPLLVTTTRKKRHKILCSFLQEKKP